MIFLKTCKIRLTKTYCNNPIIVYKENEEPSYSIKNLSNIKVLKKRPFTQTSITQLYQC